MRGTAIFILAGLLTLGLAMGAMAYNGYGMGGGYGWGGHMMQRGYHMGYGYGQGPNQAAQGYGPAYCPGLQAWQTNQGQGYGPGYPPGYGPDGQRVPVAPQPPANAQE